MNLQHVTVGQLGIRLAESQTVFMTGRDMT